MNNQKQLRRLLKLSLLMSLTIVLLWACGHRIPQDGESFLRPVSGSSASECRLIKHVMGETCVPNQAQRIVVIDHSTLEALIALGVEPIGTATRVARWGSPFPPYLEAQLQGINTIGDDSQPSLEKIVQLKPDLILAADWLGGIYDKLSRIAPTVLFDWYVKQDVQAYLRQIAQIVNRTEQAEKLLADYHRRIKDFKVAMGQRLETTEVSVIQYGFDRLRLTSKSIFAGKILEDAGVSRPPMQDVFDPGGVIDISLELLPEIDGDVLLLFNPRTQNEKQLLEKLQRNPLWSKLNAVNQERVYYVDAQHWMFGNILAADHILDDLFQYLVQERQ